MSGNRAHRNLLFGVMAMQMDFISREQLIAVTSSWTKEKSVGLDEYLVQHGALERDTHQLLVGLVNKHLELHDDDAQKSLESISTLDTSIQNELRKLGDPEVDATVQHSGLLSATISSIEHETLPGDPVQFSVRGNGRFRILRPHAKGGLGEVFVADDTELNREVAVKEIKAGAADSEELRSRFVMEAEITGRLEHPGVVPVYGLGKTPDGRPFYAMRFVRGDSLKKAVDRFHQKSQNENGQQASERSVEFRKLIGRVIDICQAIQYAHNRGVLHRDLKPGNIMLGKYGETLVVDWGLAKVIGSKASEEEYSQSEGTLRPSSGSDVTPTQMGVTVGTPAFMSPEQAAGRLSELGPPCDVYSLGATLYYVLTGHAPLSDISVEEVLQRVQTGSFPQPRQVNPSIPAPLESICLKAMALAIRDRYETPVALSEELERWLADQPVSAHPESVSQKTARWIRHHRTLVLSGAAALLLTTVVSVGSAIVVNKQRQIASDLANANEQLALKEGKAREKSDRLAIDNQSKFNQVRTLAKTFIFEVDPLIKNLPGSTSARRFVMGSGLKYLDGLREQASDDIALRNELISGYMSIGDVLGNVQTANLGDTQGAMDSYQKAIQMCRETLAAHPDDLQATAYLTALMDREGMILQTIGKSKEAMERYTESLRLSRKHTPSGSGPSINIWVAINRLGDLLHREGEIDKALEYHTEALDIIEQLTKAQPENLSFQRFHSLNLGLIGKDHRRLEQFEESLDYLKQQETLIVNLLKDHPQNATLLRDRAFLQQDFSTVLDELDRAEEGLAAARKAITYYEDLLIDPKDTRAQRDLGNAHQRFGSRLMSLERYEEAFASFEKSLERLSDLYELSPENDFFLRDVAVTYNKLGETKEEMKEYDEALEYYLESKALYEKALETSDTPEMHLRSMGIAHQNVGLVLRLQKKYADSLASYNECVQLRENLFIEHPSDVRGISDLAYILRQRSWLLSTCTDESIRDGERAMEDVVRARLLDDEKTTWLCRVLAAASAETGDFAAARTWQQKAIDLLQDDEDRDELEADLETLVQGMPIRKDPDE